MTNFFPVPSFAPTAGVGDPLYDVMMQLSVENILDGMTVEDWARTPAMRAAITQVALQWLSQTHNGLTPPQAVAKAYQLLQQARTKVKNNDEQIAKAASFPWLLDLPWYLAPFWAFLRDVASKWSPTVWKRIQKAASALPSTYSYSNGNQIWGQTDMNLTLTGEASGTVPYFLSYRIPWSEVPWGAIKWNDKRLPFVKTADDLIFLIQHPEGTAGSDIANMPSRQPFVIGPIPTGGLPSFPLPTGLGPVLTGFPFPTGGAPTSVTGPTGGEGDSSQDPGTETVASCLKKGKILDALSGQCIDPAPTSTPPTSVPTGVVPNFTTCAGALKLFDPRTGQCVDVPDDQASQDVIQSCAAQGYFYNPATNQCVLANGTPAGLQPSGSVPTGIDKPQHDDEEKDESHTGLLLLGAGGLLAAGLWWWSTRTPSASSDTAEAT